MAQVIEGRVVMLELSGEHYFRLDAVGSRMWELLRDLGDVDAAHAQLLTEYEVDPDTLRHDLDALVTQLADSGLIGIETPES